MPPTQEVATFYDKGACIYDSLMHIAGTAPTVKKLLKSLEVGVPKGGRILDLGCGTGLVTDVLKKRFPDARMTGLDYSRQMLKIYRKKHPHNESLEGDFNDEATFRTYPAGRKSGLSHESFDLIISSGAVSEYGDLQRCVPLVYNLLTPGGVFVNIGVKENLVNKISSRVWKFKPASERKFIAACARAGFKRTQTLSIPSILFPTSYLKYAVKAQK